MMDALLDVTNSPKRQIIKKKKRLSDGSCKEYEYQRPVRIKRVLDLSFKTEADKLSFEGKLNLAKNLTEKTTTLASLITSALDLYIEKNQEDINQQPNIDNTNEADQPPDDNQEQKGATDMETEEFQAFSAFVCEISSLHELLELLHSHSVICPGRVSLRSEMKGHAACGTLLCERSVDHEMKWCSSSSLGDKISHMRVNISIMNAFMCSGMQISEYDRFCSFARIGKLSWRQRQNMNTTLSSITEVLLKESITEAREEEMFRTEANGGEPRTLSIMTDARHACRRNSYHTDHVALGQLTHKVVDFQHVTKEDDICTQRHEALACRRMYDKLDAANIHVSDHAHDRNASINNIVKAREGTTNSNDKWHVTKPIPTRVKKVGTGAKKNIGKTWHPQLADKGALLRNHVFWSIDNCGKDPGKLKELISCAITHFQNKHDNCAINSPCKQVGYVPSFIIVNDPSAIHFLTDVIYSLTAYQHPEDYIYGKDTYYVESCNNAALIYLDKRIHYKNMSYAIRQALWLLDWNENVDREYTSMYSRMHVANARQQKGKKNYKKKTYCFVSAIWNLWIKSLKLNNKDSCDSDEHSSDVDSDFEDDLE